MTIWGNADVTRLFIVFNVIGFGFSILTLWISHDLLGLTTRLDDNLSANVLGVATGSEFRYWSYRHFVVGDSDHQSHDPVSAGS